MSNKKGILFGFTTAAAAVLAAASVASACVTFMGTAEVVGHDGRTEVTGTGNSHSYCSDGRPTTAAAGHLGDLINVAVKPGKCSDAGAAGDHQLPEGTYEVRYNNELSYTYDGTYWNMLTGLGCFRTANADTSTILGTFAVDAAGKGSWSGTLGTLKQDPFFATSLTASNLCIGAPSLPPVNGIIPGNLAPYRLLAI